MCFCRWWMTTLRPENSTWRDHGTGESSSEDEWGSFTSNSRMKKSSINSTTCPLHRENPRKSKMKMTSQKMIILKTKNLMALKRRTVTVKTQCSMMIWFWTRNWLKNLIRSIRLSIRRSANSTQLKSMMSLLIPSSLLMSFRGSLTMSGQSTTLIFLRRTTDR